jgi:aminoglycoside phosphotransferase
MDAWRVILRHVLRVHAEFTRYPVQIDQSDALEMYVGKTRRRLEMLVNEDSQWEDRLSEPFVNCDGLHLRNVRELWPSIERTAATLSKTIVPGIVHGDLCFSNILFDFNSQIMRLIDPRGRFGRRTIYGDTRYDLAKIRHSVSGLYDFILADMFQIEETGEGVVTEFVNAQQARKVGELFDGLMEEAGHDVTEIQFIEGLLFLSMLPLHKENPRRQRMMYYTGLRLLNEVL